MASRGPSTSAPAAAARPRNAAGSSSPKKRSFTALISAPARSILSRPFGARLSNTPRPSSGLRRLSRSPRRASLLVSTAMKALDTCSACATAPTLTPVSPCRCAIAISTLYCGPVMPMRRPWCARTISMRVAMVRRSATSARKRRSEPRSSSASRVAVGGSTNSGVAPSCPARAADALAGAPARARRRPPLEIDIAGVAEELRLDRNVQAVVHRVVELPEADHAGELDELRRGQMLLEALQDLVGHRGRILGGRAHVVEAGALRLVLRLVGAGDDVLQLLLVHAPALEALVLRLLEHRAAVRRAVGAAVGRAGDRRELALEQLIERRRGIAHDVAVEPPQRLGDLGPMGIELERVRQEAHAHLVGLDHRLEARIEIRLAHVGNERLALDEDFRLGRRDGIHGDGSFSRWWAHVLVGEPASASPRHALQVVGQLDLPPVARPGALEIGGVVARLDGGVDADLADDTPGKLTVERTRRGGVGRAARARHDDDVAR